MAYKSLAAANKEIERLRLEASRLLVMWGDDAEDLARLAAENDSYRVWLAIWAKSLGDDAPFKAWYREHVEQRAASGAPEARVAMLERVAATSDVLYDGMGLDEETPGTLCVEPDDLRAWIQALDALRDTAGETGGDDGGH